MMEDEIKGNLYTERDELSFLNCHVYPNESGNICIRFDDKNFAELSPVMAKRLKNELDEAIRESLAMILGE